MKYNYCMIRVVMYKILYTQHRYIDFNMNGKFSRTSFILNNKNLKGEGRFCNFYIHVELPDISSNLLKIKGIYLP